MKIVISDYPNTLNRNIDYEIQLLSTALTNVSIVIHPYVSQEAFLSEMFDADGLLTAFLSIDETILSQCPNLKCISINATGYNSIDLEAAKRHHVLISAIGEYCTTEVAEFAMTLLLCLAKKIKMHQHNVENESLWQYKLVGSVPRLAGKTLAIFGLGKIGQAFAQRALAFGMHVVAVDPYIPVKIAQSIGVKLVDCSYVFEHADIISNHMNASTDNKDYFDWDFFKQLKNQPIFLNVGRGVCVDESALLKALDESLICSAGLDVLKEDNPNLDKLSFVNRKNVILTPHTAFYSDNSIKTLQDVSCQNMIHYIKGEHDKINYIVSK